MTDGSADKKAQRREHKYLCDIQEAIYEIETHPKYPDGKNAWDADKYYRGWCYLQLARIGEAASQLTKIESPEFLKSQSDIPWQKIKGMRNVLVHVYWGIDDEIGWSAICKLPELRDKVNSWIETLNNDTESQS